MPTDQNPMSGVNPVNPNTPVNPTNSAVPQQGNQDDRLSLEDLAVELNEGLEDDINKKSESDNLNNQVEEETPASTVENMIVQPVVEETPVMEEPVPAPVVEETPVVEEPVPAPVVEETPVMEESAPAPVVEETPVMEEPVPAPVVEETPVMEESAPAPVVEETPVMEEPISAPVVEETPVVEEPIPAPVVEETPVMEEPISAPVAQVSEPENTLNLENIDTSVPMNSEGDIISDTGSVSPEVEEKYVPNESDFAKMSAVLDAAPRGQVDLSSLDTIAEQNQNPELNQNEQPVNQNNGVLNLDSIVADQTPAQPNVQDVQPVVPELDQQSMLQFDQQVIPELDQQPAQQQVEMPVGAVPPVMPGQMQQPVMPQQIMPEQMQQAMVSDQGQKRSTAGLKILLLIVVLLGVAVFILSKMYPDEFSNIIKAVKGENTTVIEYTDGTGVTLGESDEGTGSLVGDEKNDNQENENPLGTGNVENTLGTGDIEKVGGELEEHENVHGSGIEEDDGSDIMDPDSLAALLESGNSENTENNAGSDEENESTSAETGFDTMKELGLLIDEEKEGNTDIVEQLESYKVQAEKYTAWGVENNDDKVHTLGSNIISKIDELLQTIETTGEIDNTEIEKIDLKLSKISSMVNK